MKEVFEDIFSQETDDLLYYDLNTMKIKSITEFKEYHGVNVSIIAYLDRTRIPVSIDIGFNDVVYPKKEMRDFPTILSDENRKIYMYSLSTAIAEKFEAIVSLGYDNSRFKDFYDIYIISRSYDFNGYILKEALKRTFVHRKTNFNNIVIFEKDFSDDMIRINRWKSFTRKKKIELDIALDEVVKEIERFLKPLVEAIQDEKIFAKNWDHQTIS